MQGVQRTADRAVACAIALLQARHPGSRIHDVQADPRFQHRGVDLLWDTAEGLFGVEVKGDRHRAGVNYFLELVSNVEKETPGCFLYSEAHWLIYVFVHLGEAHLLPLGAARGWFLPRARQFTLRHTTTRIGAHHYTTVGALVPVGELLDAVPGAERITLPETVGQLTGLRRPSSTRRA